jgi:DHA1 family tetracycline resistance protein-like MFS transporter
VLLAVCFLMNLAGRMLESTWVLYTGYRFQWGAFEAGASLTAFGVAYAIAQVWLVRKLADTIGEWSTLLLGLVIGVGTFCIFAFAMGGWVMAVNVIPYGAATGIAGPALQALATKAMPVNRQGLLQGAIASLITATGVIGPPIGSYLFSFFIGEDAPTIFAGAPYIFAAALLGGALAVMLLWRNKLPHEGVMPEENSWPGPG